MARDLAVIGMGKLGASMAAAMASRGHRVTAVDVREEAVEALNAGRAPVQETDLERIVLESGPRLRATTSHREAILGADISFVAVPTPSDDRGAFSLQYAGWACREIGRALADRKDYHLVVISSTVLPGSMRFGLLPILERESGKRCGRDFGLCYGPAFIALGSVIRDFLNPDFCLIGEFDERSGASLEACYGDVMPDRPPVHRMSIENAELTKLAVNTYVTTKITFANMLAELCERLPGGDIDVVTRALGADARIGSRYLRGGLGYGGPCFPRDNQALGFIARALGSGADLAETTDRFNRQFAERAVGRLRPHVAPGATVAVLGLAYKPFSHVVDESQGLYLVRALSRAGVRVVAYDPLAAEGARAELSGHAVIFDSLAEALAQADVVVLATPDPAFRSLGATDLLAGGKATVTVVDFWRVLDPGVARQPGVRYVAFGRADSPETGAGSLATLWGGAGT
ncbi:MAG: UDP-glucose/GDP-mannose dehydrogenase family protein [Verrucomicrobiae bacterium]|nr:UDP-glucose/GDP-mannose dehydrogenase family protein [Verrucomicrobiae bacterium]